MQRPITQHPNMACCNALYTSSTSILDSLVYFCRNIPFKMNIGPAQPKPEHRTRYRLHGIVATTSTHRTNLDMFRSC